MDRGAWWATVLGIAKSWTQLSNSTTATDKLGLFWIPYWMAKVSLEVSPLWLVRISTLQTQNRLVPWVFCNLHLSHGSLFFVHCRISPWNVYSFAFSQRLQENSICISKVPSLHRSFLKIGGLATKSYPTLAALWTVAHQAPLPMEFSRQEYWSKLSFPTPRKLLYPGIKPRSPALQADSLPTELWGKRFSRSPSLPNPSCLTRPQL